MIALKVAAALLSVSFVSVNAAPASIGAVPKVEFPDVDVTIYDDLELGGNKEVWHVPFKGCETVPPGWNDKIRSLTLEDPESYMCTFYTHDNCKGDGHSTTEDKDLSDGSGKHDHSISSASCYRNSHGLPPI